MFIARKQGSQNMIIKNQIETNMKVHFLLNSDSRAQAIVGSVMKSIPLSGGLSGDEAYLINDKFVLKKFNIYNTKAVEIQKQAALLAIAPNILYENSKEHFVLMEFAGKSSVPRDQHTIKNLAHFLKTLHKVTPTNDMLPLDPFEKVQNALQFLQSKNLPQEILNKFVKVLSLKKYANNNGTICHNDLNPNNLLFSNDKVIAIDWDAAGLNDPYYDLATIAMWYITVPEIEKKLLKEYLGRDSKISELKHLDIMKKVVMAIIGENLIKAGIKMGCTVKPETPSDSLSEFLPKIGRGEVKLDSGKKLYEFGLILLKEI